MDVRNFLKRVNFEAFRTGFAVLATAAIVIACQGSIEDASEDAAVTNGDAASSVEVATATGAVEAAEEGSDHKEMAAEEGSGHKDGEGSGHKLPVKAICVLSPTAGNEVQGSVTFTQTDDGVLIEASLSGLTPGKHGFHIHQYGDISSPDGKSTGGHYNPASVDHAAPDSAVRHVGDLGNLNADESGNATYSRVDTAFNIHSVLARGITVHAGEDDLTSQPTGAAGARVAVGVIGVAKAE